MSNDMIYVLSSGGTAGGSMFLKGPVWLNEKRTSILDEVTTNLYQAKTFATEKEAWEWREICASTDWTITRIDAKRIFIGRLAG